MPEESLSRVINEQQKDLVNKMIMDAVHNLVFMPEGMGHVEELNVKRTPSGANVTYLFAPKIQPVFVKLAIDFNLPKL